MTRESSSLITEVMEAISALVPLSDGGSWSGSFTPAWPKDYSTSEIEIRRAIATVAVLTVLAAQGRAP